LDEETIRINKNQRRAEYNRAYYQMNRERLIAKVGERRQKAKELKIKNKTTG